MSIYLLCFWCGILIFDLPSYHAVQINYIKVPSAVQNNTNESVVLDCNYSIRPDDTELVVKWYLNDALVYQWIPPNLPQALGVMAKRLDLDYRASPDSKLAYRAMKLINPTSELAGEYKCFVSTFSDEDFSYKTMAIFEPESEMLLLRGRSNAINANFSCVVFDVYPAPKLTIFKDKKDDITNKNNLNSVELDIQKLPSDRYNVYLTATAPTSSLYSGQLIHCDMKIPKTGYVKRKSLLYYSQIINEYNGMATLFLAAKLYLYIFLIHIFNNLIANLVN